MSPDAVSASACGKLILLGEHAVVHGSPALVLGVERRLVALARASHGPVSRLRLGTNVCEADGASADELARAFAALLAEEGGAPPVEVEVTGDLPPGVGLGFSAAAGVAVARAVQELAHGEPQTEPVLRRATAWERVFHGNPSGVDTAAAFHGGCLRFRRGEPIERVALAGEVHLCVGLTGTRSSTKEMVEGVARLRADRPPLVEEGVAAITALVDNAVRAVESGDAAALGQLMDLNQMILAGWLLSSTEIETLCRLAREHGALGCKLTGAGGGGATVALLGIGAGGEARAGEVLGAWREAGFDGFAVRVGAGGNEGTHG